MPYDWYDYLVFARNLHENPEFLKCICKEETIERNIVSRAYYSAFHHAKKYAETHGRVTFPETGTHRAVKDWFRSNQKFNMWNDLRELSNWRDDCDYKDEVPNLGSLVKKSVKGSERFHHYR
jgi:uncharacterized protein (UPF0332 family)